MEALLNILLTWQFVMACSILTAVLITRWRFKKAVKNEKFKTIIQQLSKGFLGLTSSRKGTLCLILFFCALLPMTLLCVFGKLDSTAYATCMSAITVAVTAIFCHTQSKTDQMLGMPGLPVPSNIIDTIIGSNGSASQTMSGPGITVNSTPIIPVVPGVDIQPVTADNTTK
jgi:hypothetical protein